RAAQDALIERLTDYYLSNRRLAFAAAPKSMTLMDDQYYSQTFRRGYPKFNGLIWSYHWLQVGLYEPLIAGRTITERKAGVLATIARFWSMIDEAPSRFPTVMPMTSAVAPQFSQAHPRAAIIFDNLHMTHDIISDILASTRVPHDRKREVIYAALDQMQDSIRDVMTVAEWREMAAMMGGVATMGGPATDLLSAAPTRAADMPVMDDMPGIAHGIDSVQAAAPTPAPDSVMTRLMMLQKRVTKDTAICGRAATDPVLRRLLEELTAILPPEHRSPPCGRPARSTSTAPTDSTRASQSHQHPE
ncbi:MAG: hypothetical protein ABJB33_01645, partial [Gemmatimonadota bacterium]